MVDIDRGDRVFAIKNLPESGWTKTVDKGTKGTVVGVERPFFGSDEFTVKFDNGEILEVSEKVIYPED